LYVSVERRSIYSGLAPSNDSAVSAVAVPGGGHAELPGCGRRDYFV
jgi:hypothetical protein